MQLLATRSTVTGEDVDASPRLAVNQLGLLAMSSSCFTESGDHGATQNCAPTSLVAHVPLLVQSSEIKTLSNLSYLVSASVFPFKARHHVSD